MIDKKIIKDACWDIFHYNFLGAGEDWVEKLDGEKEELYSGEQVSDAIQLGIEWAQKEFVKSLWYAPIVEAEPRRDIIAISKKGMVYAFKFEYDDDWRQMFHRYNIERFCYLDDILPKEGGEQ